MGNAHGHKRPPPGPTKRRHSMPSSSVPNLSSVNHDDDGDDGLPVNTGHNSSFSCDPMAAMLKHHNRVRQPGSKLFRGEEEKHEEFEIPVFDLQDSSKTNNNSSNHDGNKSLTFENLNKSEYLDDGFSFYTEEKSDANLAMQQSLRADNNNNNSQMNIHHSSMSMSRSSPMSLSAANNDSSRAMSMSGQQNNSSSRNHADAPLEESQKSNIDHSRRQSPDQSRRRSQMLSSRAGKSSKRSSRRRSSMYNSSYDKGEKELLNNLAEVETFLKKLQQKEPEVRQRFLIESLQRQAGASRRVLMGDESGESLGRSSGHSSRRHGSRGESPHKLGDSSTRRRKSSKSKKRRDSGMSASTPSLYTSTRRASDLVMGASNNNRRSSRLHENLPTLLEQKSAHHRLPASASKPLKRATQNTKSQRRSSTGSYVPDLTPMSDNNNKTAAEEQKPEKRPSIFQMGLKRLSLGDQSKLPAGNMVEFLAEKELRRSQSPANRRRSRPNNSSLDHSSGSHASSSRRSSTRNKDSSGHARRNESESSKSPKRSSRRGSALTAWMGR
jgi:hypothetical protein